MLPDSLILIRKTKKFSSSFAFPDLSPRVMLAAILATGSPFAGLDVALSGVCSGISFIVALMLGRVVSVKLLLAWMKAWQAIALIDASA